jgi:hypothetical protein
MSFSQSDLDALEARLKALGDEKYRKFNEGLIPGKENATYGVRIPALRAAGRELCRGDWRAFLDFAPVQSSTVHEIVTLCGIVTAAAKCPEDERMARTAAFIPRVDNWAANDITCATYRIPAASRAAWLDFLRPYTVCGTEFGERFALVLLMDQFARGDTLDEVLDACLRARCPGYYTRMAVAWTLCTAFCHDRDRTLAFLQDARGASLDAWTFNKAIQKCRESYRVSDADKALLLSMKRPV